MKRLALAAASLIAITTVLSSSTPAILAAAATSNAATSGQALEIAPPVITMTVNPGQVVHTQLQLRDIASGDLYVTGQTNDFVAAGEDGTPKILLNNNENDPYSLKDWITPPAALTLQPKQIKTLPITINVPANASPGGHYGVIRFSAVPPELKGTGVSLSASLGSLVLLTVNGNIQHKLAIQQFSVSKNGKAGHLFQSTPLTLTEVIKNTGNVHEEPTAVITVKDFFGRTLAGVSVNYAKRNVLPGSSRKFVEPLDKTAYGSHRFFGRYTATMKLTYANNQTLTSSVSFWVIPYKLIFIIIILLIAGFFFVRYLVRRHDEKVMRRMHKMQSQKFQNKK
ncbi:MAG TPA: hypothetical protein VFT49_02890 [Candidatus Saccharimonadales bacterium]|nr:hypothetical protein [Candidatus Saccharimonadales bacterium]